MNNLNDFYSLTCKKFKDKTIFDEIYTYDDASKLSGRRTKFLQSKGYKKGDVIAILAANSLEWCITYMAITSAGMIALPLDTNLTRKNYSEMSKIVNLKGIFYSKELKDKLPPKIKSFDISLEQNLHKSEKFKIEAVSKDHIASLVFTSGTTGTPKVVQLSHENVFGTAISAPDRAELSENDKFLCILPLYHVYAFVANFIGPFTKGCSFIFLRSLKGPDIIKTLTEHSFTVFPAAPQLWELFMDSILSKTRAQSRFKYRILIFLLYAAPLLKALGLSRILKKVFKPVKLLFGAKMRYFISGGAPLKRKYFQYYNRMGLPIVEGYGLTETTGPICLCGTGDNRAGSVGQCIDGNEVIIKNLNKDGIGEIWLKGVSVMPGYYKNPKLNTEVFDENNYFNTGDLGRIDKDRFLYITGRHKNVIVLDSGKNVYPEELESHYKKSTEISEICVFGKTTNGRETVYAVIVPAKKTKNSYATIKKEIFNLSKGMPTYKTISGFSISFDPLPKNSTRKILTREVVRMLEKGIFMDEENDKVVLQNELIPANENEEKIIKFIRKKTSSKVIYANQTYTDLGIDSLRMIDIIAGLEELMNLNIDIDHVKNLNTMEEFVHYVSSCPESEGSRIDDLILRSETTTEHRPFFNPVNSSLLHLTKFFGKHSWSLQAKGTENFNVKNVIIAANHQSNLDVAVLLSVIPQNLRKDIFIIGKKELSILKYVFPGMNVVYVDREGDIVPALKASADLLRAGKSLIIFPEGTRSTSGKLRPFKSGTAYLSKNLGIKVIPVGINGTKDVLPRGKKIPTFFKPSLITVKAGKPIDPAKFKSIDGLNEAIFKEVKKNVG